VKAINLSASNDRDNLVGLRIGDQALCHVFLGAADGTLQRKLPSGPAIITAWTPFPRMFASGSFATDRSAGPPGPLWGFTGAIDHRQVVACLWPATTAGKPVCAAMAAG
jgi:hypothetical protein